MAGKLARARVLAPGCSLLAHHSPALEQLKIKLQSKLNQPRIVDCCVNEPKRSDRTGAVRIRQSKLSVVEQVENFSPEIQPHALSIGQHKVFNRREIRIYEVRTVDGSSTCISQFARSRCNKTLRVKPLA